MNRTETRVIVLLILQLAGASTCWSATWEIESRDLVQSAQADVRFRIGNDTAAESMTFYQGRLQSERKKLGVRISIFRHVESGLFWTNFSVVYGGLISPAKMSRNTVLVALEDRVVGFGLGGEDLYIREQVGKVESEQAAIEHVVSEIRQHGDDIAAASLAFKRRDIFLRKFFGIDFFTLPDRSEPVNLAVLESAEAHQDIWIVRLKGANGESGELILNHAFEPISAVVDGLRKFPHGK